MHLASQPADSFRVVALGHSSKICRIESEEEPCHLQDVSYVVKDRRNRRSRLTILQGVSGFFSPGEMAAVMGPSGSGDLQSPPKIGLCSFIDNVQ